MNDSKIHPASSLSDLGIFNHWDVPPTQRDVERLIVTEQRPIATLSSASNVEFHFKTAFNEHVLLNKTNLYIRLSVKIAPSSDATPIKKEDWASFSPANYLLHSLFKNVEVLINGKETCSKPSTYSYRAYLDAKFGFTSDAKKSHLTAALWNDNAIERSQAFQVISDDTRVVELMGRLHIDLGFQGRTILGGSDIRVILTPNDPTFYFNVSSPAIRGVAVRYDDASLYVTSALLTPQFVAHHNAGIVKSPAKYFMTSAEVRHDTINAGSLDKSFDNVCNGRLPRLLILQLVDSQAQNGSFASDPYQFNHFGLSYACAYINGHQVPLNAYQMDFSKGIYLRAFTSLSQAVNQDGMDSILSINRANFVNGNVHIAFNFAQDGSTGMASSVNPILYGNLRVVLRFKEKTSETLTALFYCSYDTCLEIDESRSVIS